MYNRYTLLDSTSACQSRYNALGRYYATRVIVYSAPHPFISLLSSTKSAAPPLSLEHPAPEDLSGWAGRGVVGAACGRPSARQICPCRISIPVAADAGWG